MIVNKFAQKQELMMIGIKLSARVIDKDAEVEYDAITQEPILPNYDISFWADPQESNYQDLKNGGGLVNEQTLRLTVLNDCPLKQGDLVFYNGGTYETVLVKQKLNRKFVFIKNKNG